MLEQGRAALSDPEASHDSLVAHAERLGAAAVAEPGTARGVLLATLTAGLPPNGIALLLAAPSLLLAVACNIVAQHAFAGLSFWFGDSGAAWFLYQKLIFMIGGMLIPPQVLPGWLQGAARVLPFRAMAYAPGRLASGHVEPMILVEQLGWLVVLCVIATSVFGAGERRLQVVGKRHRVEYCPRRIRWTIGRHYE